MRRVQGFVLRCINVASAALAAAIAFACVTAFLELVYLVTPGSLYNAIAGLGWYVFIVVPSYAFGHLSGFGSSQDSRADFDPSRFWIRIAMPIAAFVLAAVGLAFLHYGQLGASRMATVLVDTGFRAYSVLLIAVLAWIMGAYVHDKRGGPHDGPRST
jgi:hypothetical protein